MMLVSKLEKQSKGQSLVWIFFQAKRGGQEITIIYFTNSRLYQIEIEKMAWARSIL